MKVFLLLIFCIVWVETAKELPYINCVIHRKATDIVGQIVRTYRKIDTSGLDKAAGLLDRNKNRFFEKDELMHWLIEFHSILTEDDNKHWFSSFDSNMDGFLSWYEYMGDLTTYYTPEEHRDSESAAMFLSADKDLNEKLDKMEFHTILYGPFESPLLPLIAIQVLKHDRDGDKSLSIHEVIDQNESHSLEVRHKIQDLFAACDLDDSESLEGDELLIWQMAGYICDLTVESLGIVKINPYNLPRPRSKRTVSPEAENNRIRKEFLEPLSGAESAIEEL